MTRHEIDVLNIVLQQEVPKSKEQDRVTALAVHVKDQMTRSCPGISSSWNVVAGPANKFSVDSVSDAFADVKVDGTRYVIFRAKYVQDILQLPSGIALFKIALLAVPAALFVTYLWKSQSCEAYCLNVEGSVCTEELTQEQARCTEELALIAKISVYVIIFVFVARFAMRRFKI